ncbi:hypothetical protein J3R82DRAFT_2095 [Butyriboletus roseoflavus]|nr:hypothetical protein J3R82DRAFT_2095 [Butyriboletus roseoflavus]
MEFQAHSPKARAVRSAKITIVADCHAYTLRSQANTTKSIRLSLVDHIDLTKAQLSSLSSSRPKTSQARMDDGTPPPPDHDVSPPPPPPTAISGSPTDFLKGVVGKRVIVRLTSGVDYRGILSCLDGYMNIALEQTEEHVNGVVTNKYGDAFIRGNNVLYISAAELI